MAKTAFSGNARTSAVSFSILDKGYLGTGIDSSGNLLKDFWAYDPTNDTWTQVADFAGSARIGAVGFSIDSLGYIGLGDDGTTLRKDVWEYSPQNNSWVQVQNLGLYASVTANGRKDASVAVASGKAYIICGYDGSTTYSKQCWQFDPVADTSWTIRKNFMNASDFTLIGRRWGTAFSLNSQIYFGTGFDHTQNYKNDFWKYNPFTDTWNQLPNVPGLARSNAISFSFDGMGYVGCGVSLNQQTDLWQYDFNLNSWTGQPDYPGLATANNISFVINNRAFVGLGTDTFNVRHTDFWEFIADSLTGVEINENLESVKLYPNPVSDYCILELSSSLSKYIVEFLLYDKNGKIQIKRNIEDSFSVISKNGMASGIYYYTIRKNGEYFSSGKLIFH